MHALAIMIVLETRCIPPILLASLLALDYLPFQFHSLFPLRRSSATSVQMRTILERMNQDTLNIKFLPCCPSPFTPPFLSIFPPSPPTLAPRQCPFNYLIQ